MPGVSTTSAAVAAVLPPKPVISHITSYNGTSAKPNPNMAAAIPATFKGKNRSGVVLMTGYTAPCERKYIHAK